MVLILTTQPIRDKEKIKGFRPLTGIMVLIGKFTPWNEWEDHLFPSPYGDYGSYHGRI